MLFKENQTARAQHDAVRKNIGWYKWTHDLVEVSGTGAAAFLDYLYVNSIAKIAISGSKYTTMLDEAGRITDDVIVMRVDEDLFWVSTLYAPQLIDWMDGKKSSYDVAYRDATKETDMYSVQGPNAKALINRIAADTVDSMKRFSLLDSTISEASVKIHKGGFPGEDGSEIFCGANDSDSVKDAIESAGKEFGAAELTVLEVYVRSLPVEKGYALRQDLYGLTPYECDLGWSVGLEKDFVGKEAVLQAVKDGPRFSLVGIEYGAESYEDITQRERIYCQGVDIGFVRAAVYGYTVDKNIGFAVVRADKAAPGVEVTVGSNNSPARIVEKRWV
jgi:glycine cleavage system aminomethyltransferase T